MEKTVQITTTRAKSFFAALGLFAALLLAEGAQASTVWYEISVDTSGLSGPGYLDFQFNPGNTPMKPGQRRSPDFKQDSGNTGNRWRCHRFTGTITVTAHSLTVPPGVSTGAFSTSSWSWIFRWFLNAFWRWQLLTLDVEDSSFNLLGFSRS